MLSTVRAVTVLAVLGSGVIAAGVAVASTSDSSVGWMRASDAALPGAGGASSATLRNLTQADAVTIRRVWHPTVVQKVDLPPVGPSPGDQVVFGGPLYNAANTKQVGFLSGHCTSTNPTFRSLAECEVTAVPTARGPSLAAGNQITMQGWNDNTPFPFTQAITGGTGIYATARGQLTATPGARFLVVFQLVR
jgi:hypothetical protein